MAVFLPESIRCRLGYLLAKSHQRQLALFDKHTAELSVSGREYAALLALEANAGLRQSDIAELLGVDRTTTTYLIDAMEQRGWLTRERDPADRRAHRVVLTADGLSALEVIRPAARASTEELLTALNESERVLLKDLLTRVIES
ncbi:MarR family transcriptional regulator [Salinisphaera sp. T31B1]|uniref:MarR family winged helix-turn-helix transcriptional regulator n=1 Tax=Salinisphaera sp. T31B1 TaxID=727963 RepID=UPI003341919B